MGRDISHFLQSTGTAVIEIDGQEYSYAQLAVDVGELSAFLAGSGSLRVVALDATRSYASIVALLACMQAGVTFCFIPTTVPENVRQARYLAGGVSHRLHSVGGAYSLEPVGGDMPGKAVPWDYVSFSSGSAGVPKAIAGNVGGVEAFTAWQAERFHISGSDVFGQLTTPSFDVYLRDVLTPLRAGATVAIATDNDLGDLAGFVARRSVTCLHVVPSIAQRGIRAASGPVESLRWTFFAGEMLKRSLVDAWQEVFPSSSCVNFYGPTETTLAAFHHVVTDADADPIPVGQGIAGNKFSLSNDGIITIHAKGPAHGYLRDGQLVEEADFSSFRTSDRGSVGPAGLVVLGRSDNLMKKNGVLINPTDIEVTLEGLPGVEHCVALAGEGEQLTAFYNGTDTPETCATALMDKLDRVFWDTKIVQLAALPLLPNGKVDRQALKQLDVQGEEVAVDPAALAAVVAELSRVLGAQIPKDADVFGLGLTSIDVAAVTTALQGQGYTLSIFDVFHGRTARGIAARMRVEAADESGADGVVGVVPEGVPQPLSTRQRRYARVYLPFGNRNWANMRSEVQLPGQVTEEQVLAALAELVRRHDALRTVFAAGCDGQLTQTILPIASVESRLAEVLVPARDFEEFCSGVVDIESWPLLRVAVQPPVDGHSTVSWLTHHLVSDGVSQGILAKELSTLLVGEALPPAGPGYAAFLAMPRNDLARHEAYWRQVFAVPYQHHYLEALPGREHYGAQGVRATVPVPTAFVAKAATCGVTPFSLLMARMFAHFLTNSRPDMVIGTPASGRLDSRFDGTLGLFISLVCARADEEDLNAGEEPFAHEVHQRILAAMEHQEYQYDEVMALMGLGPQEDRFPLTSVFASQVDHPAGSMSADAVTQDMGVDVKFDVMAYLHHNAGTWALELQARRACFAGEDLVALAQALVS